MIRFNQPTKEQVRNYLKRRFTALTPPPSAEQIKRELGFEMIPEFPKNLRHATSKWG